MKNIVFILSVFFVISACDNIDYRILGRLADESFDGEKIYLVPLNNASVGRVDSTVIKNGQFSFQGKVDSAEIYILRGRPLLRLSLQELLVVKEPGVINVRLSENSFAGGTALNDTLQNWKENKIYFTRQYHILREKYKAACASEKEKIKVDLDRLIKKRNQYYFGFLKNNQTNIVGEMAAHFVKQRLSPEQIDALELDE